MGCGASTQNPWSNQNVKDSRKDGRSSPDPDLPKEFPPEEMKVVEYESEDLKFKQTMSKRSTETPVSRTSSINTDLNQPMVSMHTEIGQGKTIAEMEEVIAKLARKGKDEYLFLEEQDAQTGNRPIHTAAQDGHLEIVQWLISKECNVNSRNQMGATALHMAVAHDHYFVVEALLAANADGTIKNAAGNEAITGLDGDKTGSNAWDSGLNMLQSASDAAMAEAALAKIEANPEGVDKAKVAQAGMQKKADIPDFPIDKYTALIQSL
jgi:hypothetical protein